LLASYEQNLFGLIDEGAPLWYNKENSKRGNLYEKNKDYLYHRPCQ